MASANNNFKTRDEYRRQLELEEARKAGIAPAQVDEDGKEINPHIPQYMSNAPWYLKNNKPSLKHQQDWRQKASDTKDWYRRGEKGRRATTWKDGACENCGATTHATKDCFERKRKVPAKFSNRNIEADDILYDPKVNTFDSKRDRWNGYEAQDYQRVIDKYQRLEETRKKIRVKELLEQRNSSDNEGVKANNDSKTIENGNSEILIDDLDDEDKIQDNEDVGFGEVKKRVRTTAGGASGSVRNLRIREDTAKYLYNLDPNSAYYDPKSRSMRQDPLPNLPAHKKAFAGDNFVRKTGEEFGGFQALNLHSVVASEKGQDVHMQGAPSQTEKLYSQFKQRKEQLQQSNKQDILDKYKSQNTTDEISQDELALLGKTERYVEYDQSGRVIKGQAVKARSKYEEDILINNHSQIWGSYWTDGQWGYGCCHQTIKNSYCTAVGGLSQPQENGKQNQTQQIEDSSQFKEINKGISREVTA